MRMGALARIGEPAIQYLVEALEEDDVILQDRALYILAQMDPDVDVRPAIPAAVACMRRAFERGDREITSQAHLFLEKRPAQALDPIIGEWLKALDRR